MQKQNTCFLPKTQQPVHVQIPWFYVHWQLVLAFGTETLFDHPKYDPAENILTYNFHKKVLLW